MTGKKRKSKKGREFPTLCVALSTLLSLSTSFYVEQDEFTAPKQIPSSSNMTMYTALLRSKKGWLRDKKTWDYSENRVMETVYFDV